MDTPTATQPVQTLDVSVESYGEEDDAGGVVEPWGRLFPLGKVYYSLDLINEEYSFGRDEACDYYFEAQRAGKKVPHFLTLSKTHFKIFREEVTSNGDSCTVFIQDKSSNGTFVNGELIGKNKKRVLNSDDEISLSIKKNKVFIFNDCSKSASVDHGLPEDFKDKYTMSKFLGRGACGEVRLAFDKDDCQKFAVKSISKKTFSVGPVLGRAALAEVEIMKAIQHPCIIQIQDVFDTRSKLFIVLELAEGGELFDRVVEVGKFSEELSKFYFYQMLTAIKYLHDRNITHRDIKPENILLASDEEETLIKVTDFGLSKFVGENSLMKTLCGTPSYLAPEILESAGTTGYSRAVDLWSTGVILFIMLAGYPPFSDEIKEYTLKEQITQGRYDFNTKYWADISKDAKDMVKKMLTVKPGERITVQGALEHPWLRDSPVINRVKNLMETSRYSPTTPSRMGLKRPSPPSFVDGAEPAPKRPSQGDRPLTSSASNPSTPTTPSITPNSSNSTPRVPALSSEPSLTDQKDSTVLIKPDE